MKKIIVLALAVGVLGVSIPAGSLGIARAGAVNDFANGSYQLAVQPTADESGGYIQPPPGSPLPPASTKFLIGDRVQISITPNARLKVFGSLNLLNEIGSHPNRAIGTVADGPGYLGGSWYWKIDVDDGADGWMSEAGFVKLQPRFAKDDKVVTLVSLFVRTTPGGTSLGSLPLRSGVEGTIVEGPRYYNSYVWWKVNWGKVYCIGFSCADSIGWSAEADILGTTPYLAKVDTVANPPAQGGDFTLTASTPVQKGGRVLVNWGVLVPAGTLLGVNKNITIELLGPYRDSLHAPTVVTTKNFSVADAQAGSSGIDVPSNAVDGIYVVRLMFRHGTGSQIQYSAYSNTVSISGAAQAPIISSVQGPTSIKSGQTGTWKVLATDSGNSALTYFVTWGDGTSRTSMGIPGDQAASTHSYAREGSYSVDFEVYNTSGKTDKETITVVVNNNEPPVISGVAGPTSLVAGQAGTWVVSASDSNGDVLSYNVVWGDGATGAAQSGSSFTHTYSTTETYTARFTVNDGKANGSTSFDVRISVAPPKFVAGNRVKVVFHNASEAGSSNCVSNPKPPDVNWGGWSINDGALGTILEGPYVGAQSWANLWKIQFDIPVGSACWFWERSLEKLTPDDTKFSFDERVEYIGTSAAWDSVSWSGGSGFNDFNQKKGSVFSQGADSGGKWRVIFDAGRDLSVPASDLKSMGVPTGKWGFTSSNVLGRELKTGGGALIIDPYYYTVISRMRSQGGPVWYYGQQNLPPAAVALQSGSGGSWNCKSILGRNINPSVFIDDTVCRYERGNRAPQANLTGPAGAFAGVNGTWQFTASDPEGILSSYKVDWGDGIISDSTPLSGASASKDIQHTYSGVGTFTIKLTVTDGGGLTVTASLPVTVSVPCSTKFTVPNRVQVVNDAENGLNVRATPGGTLLGNQQKGAPGTVVSGPQSQGIYCWWQVDYDTAPDGWSAENWLERASGSDTVGDSTNITVISPAQGDVWQVGDPMPIRWTTPTGVTKAHIYLAGVGAIALNAPNTGSYTWTVPAILNGRALAGQTLAITIYSADPDTIYYQTSGSFSITSAGTGVCALPLLLNKDIVRTTAAMNVLVGPGTVNTVLGQQPLGAQGTIIGESQCDSSNTYRWWSVNFDLGSDGWVVQNYLTLVNRPGDGTSNQPPVISSVQGPTSLTVGQSRIWTVSASDPNGDVLSYNVVWGDGTTSAAQSESSFGHNYLAVGTYTATFTVGDGKGGSVNYIVTIRVTAGSTIATTSTPPVSTKFVIGDNVKVTGDYLKVRINASLAGNANGSRMAGDLGTITSGPWSADGYIWWKVDYDTGVDGWSVQDWLEKTTGSGSVANRVPAIDNFSGPTTLAPSAEGNWQIAATDPDGDAMTYKIDWGGDTSFWQDNFNPGPQYAGKLTSGVPKNISYWFRNTKTYSIILTVTDSKGASASKTISVTVANTSNYVPLGGYAPLWNAPDLPPLGNPSKLKTWTGPDGRNWQWVASSGLWKLIFIP